MRTTVKALLMAAGILLGCTVVATAADFCIELGDGGNTMVLKAFALPAKGTCKDTNGFLVAGPYWIKGTACGSSDGSEITFYSTGFSNTGSIYFSDFFKLQRASPTTPVTGKECVPPGSGNCSDDTYAKIACVPANVPVP